MGERESEKAKKEGRGERRERNAVVEYLPLPIGRCC